DRLELGALALDHGRAVAAIAPVGWSRRRGADRAGCRLVPPAVGDRDLVPARVAHPEVDQLGAVPVALPVEFVLEGGQLLELVEVVAGTVDGVGGSAVAQRDRGHAIERLREGLGAKAGRVPGDD